MSTATYSIPLDSGRTEVREALRFENVTCTFAGNGKKAQTYTAVSEGNLTIGDGEFVSIVGPTGCGKSTLLNVAAGTDTALVGQPERVRQKADAWPEHAGGLSVPG